MTKPETTDYDPQAAEEAAWREARDAAWRAYQENRGNLTTREENMIERAFKAGWLACRETGAARTLRSAQRTVVDSGVGDVPQNRLGRVARSQLRETL